jgi:hypothetical protein
MVKAWRVAERDGLLISNLEQPWIDLDFYEPKDSINAATTESIMT